MAIPEKGYLSRAFEVSGGKRTLYHCIPAAPQGSAIRTSDRYGMKIPQNIVDTLKLRTHDENLQGGTPLVFASAYLSKALAFGLQGNLGEKIFNMSVEGTDSELVLACNRDETMARVRDITVFSFPDEGFMDLEPEKRQSVSSRPVPFSKAQVAVQAKSAADLMRAGLQIFTLKETFNEAHADPSLAKVVDGENFYDAARELVQEGRLVWENHARGINPNPVLAHKIGVALPSSKMNIKAVVKAP